MRRGLVITVAAMGLLVAGAPAASAATKWAIQLTPLPAGANTGALNAVSCTAAASCTAVGSAGTHIRHGELNTPLAEHWDGSTWTLQPMPSPAGLTGVNLRGVSCAAAASCTAAGIYTTGSGTGTMILPFAEHWDGSTWTVQLMPLPPA